MSRHAGHDHFRLLSVVGEIEFVNLVEFREALSLWKREASEYYWMYRFLMNRRIIIRTRWEEPRERKFAIFLAASFFSATFKIRMIPSFCVTFLLKSRMKFRWKHFRTFLVTSHRGIIILFPSSSLKIEYFELGTFYYVLLLVITTDIFVFWRLPRT